MNHDAREFRSLLIRSSERSATSAALLFARLQWSRSRALCESELLQEAKRLEHAIDRSPSHNGESAVEINRNSIDCLHLVAKTCSQSGQPFVEDLALTVRTVAARAEEAFL